MISTTLTRVGLSLLLAIGILYAQVPGTPPEFQVYRNCGNLVRLGFTPDDDISGLVVSATEAKIFGGSSSSTRAWLLTPYGTAPTTVVRVGRMVNGQFTLLKELTFNIHEVPLPTIEMYINGVQIPNGSIVAKGAEICFAVKPERTFSLMKPSDARYEIDEVEVQVSAGRGHLQTTGKVKGGAGKTCLRLSSTYREATQGETVYLHITRVNRRNFAGHVFPELQCTEALRTFTVQVK